MLTAPYLGRQEVPLSPGRRASCPTVVLTESVNEGWNNSIPFTNTRPQPDYSVGFKRDAFTEDQLTKLSPLIGDFIAGCQSLYMATYYMYFPFLTCEVKCGAAALGQSDGLRAV